MAARANGQLWAALLGFRALGYLASTPLAVVLSPRHSSWTALRVMLWMSLLEMISSLSMQRPVSGSLPHFPNSQCFPWLCWPALQRSCSPPAVFHRVIPVFMVPRASVPWLWEQGLFPPSPGWASHTRIPQAAHWQDKKRHTAWREVVSINQQTTRVGRDVKEGEPFCTVGGNADGGSHRGKQYGDSSKS